MQVCAQCGEVNPDDGSRCTECGGPLVPRRSLQPKQTVMGIPSPHAGSAAAFAAVSPGGNSPGMSTKQTLLGLQVSPGVATGLNQAGSASAPTGFNPKATLIGGVVAPGSTEASVPAPQQSATPERSNTQVGHSPGQFQRSPDLVSTAILHPGADGANVGSTLLGMTAPGPNGGRTDDGRGSSIPPVPPTADSLPPTGPRETAPGTITTGPQRTIMGVAVPGVAPLNPGIENATPVPAPDRPTPTRSPLPIPRPPGVPDSAAGDEEWPFAVKRQRNNALVLLGAAAGLALFVVAFLLWWDTAPPMEARVTVDATGQEQLELRCADCPDGSRVSLGQAHGDFKSGLAKLPLKAPLHIGKNELSVSLERPGIGRDESIPLSVPVHFKLHADLKTLTQTAPAIAIDVEAAPQSRVEVDGKAVQLSQGKARVAIDVGDQLRGASSEPSELMREISYRVMPKEAQPVGGKLELRLPIVPLVVSSPGAELVTDKERFMLAGATSAGGRVSIGGKAINVNADGNFDQLMSIDSEGETTIMIRADADGHAPRLVPLSIKRVADLRSEASKFRATAIQEYAAAASSVKTSPGSQVALQGAVEEARMTDNTTVLLLNVDKGCSQSPCLVRVLSPVKYTGKKGDEVEVFGVVRGELEGAEAEHPVLEVEASFVLP